MPARRSRNLRWALLLSLLLNHAVLIPGAYHLLQLSPSPDPARTDPPIEVEVVSEQLPPARAQARRPVPLPARPLSPQQPPEPEPELELKPPPPPPEKEQPPLPRERERQKMVELSTPESETPPDKARYLSDKDRRTEQETRARQTNLVSDHPKPEPQAAPSDMRAPEPGQREQKIAEDRERPAPRALPQATPQVSPLLSMRAPQREREAREEVEAQAEQAPDGTLQPGQQAQAARRAVPRSRPQLSLNHSSLDRIDGAAANQARELARLSPSAPRGYTDRKWQRIRSALENFIPEVRPGNQTALNTRADPFAVYIAHMHRRIHKLWGFGFIVDLERKPAGNPLNDYNLWTMIEIVVQPDGQVHKATIVKPSGILAFDVAALDTVFGASPYPRTPSRIRSADGRVYMHWRFHRDQRQCGTFGVDPYILTTPPGKAAPPVDDLLGAGDEQPPPAHGCRFQQHRPLLSLGQLP